jgi:hypothetical protein
MGAFYFGAGISAMLSTKAIHPICPRRQLFPAYVNTKIFATMK